MRERQALTEPRSRSTELTEILGSYCDGPGHDAALTQYGRSDARNAHKKVIGQPAPVL